MKPEPRTMAVITASSGTSTPPQHPRRADAAGFVSPVFLEGRGRFALSS